MDIFDKVSFKKFDLNYFIEKYGFQKGEDYEDFNLYLLEDIDGILLEDLFVNHRFKGQGFGSAFVDGLKEKGKPIILYSSVDSIDFWVKMGFSSEKFDGEYIFAWGL
ncbi:hypothetical protein PQE75_gp043 [Bacillus phage vB_BcoS-136]|uniref:N-acetyltransferase domain-containing protein n=1 Tax=Bacillus phage vB_BcoS-136 TaxID=2419619 RepID=A0A3G3BVA6_9CAUD|nr:hypothetical protein PQE75_gp043 [Bacillus phage vB_BcoS-136]AYP68175.1 hypothetical protein vBBcoS136_00043 [Bacillus phage vB_BcoS-136]